MTALPASTIKTPAARLQPSRAGDHDALLHNLRVLAQLVIPEGAYSVEATPYRISIQGLSGMRVEDLQAALGPATYEPGEEGHPYETWTGHGFRIAREVLS